MSALLHRLRGEEGVAMATVVLLTSVLIVLSATMVSLVTGESTRSVTTAKAGTALQAAEAGLDDYLAKLVQDKSYYYRFVHPAESTRQGTSGAPVDPSDTCVVTADPNGGSFDTKVVTRGGSTYTSANTETGWTGSATWTYAAKDNWCQLANGYEYNLQVTAPSATDFRTKIVATGRPIGQTVNTGQWRALEEWVHFSLISDYQMIANQDISYGSTATTNGKIYAGRDSSGVNHDVNHDGTATANIYAEGTITGSTTLAGTPTAKKYAGRTAVANAGISQPINFANFQLALDDIKAASGVSGNLYDSTTGYTAASYKLVFSGNGSSAGSYTIAACTSSNPASSSTAPSCGAASAAKAIPTNGAIYVESTAIVSGQIDGRVTVASNNDIVIGGDITYETSGDDVFGMIGKNNVYIGNFVGSTLSWRGGSIAQNGEWRSYSCSPVTKTLMTFTGSTATNDGGCASNFGTRSYNYDTTLFYLPPPWFPALEDKYVVDLFREVQP